MFIRVRTYKNGPNHTNIITSIFRLSEKNIVVSYASILIASFLITWIQQMNKIISEEEDSCRLFAPFEETLHDA